MLNKDEACKLALNGYSKEDLIALGFTFDVSDKPDNNDVSDKPDNNNESGKPDNNNEAGKPDNTTDVTAELVKTVAELSNTVKELQKANIKGAETGDKGGNNRQSASDVVKDFIKGM